MTDPAAASPEHGAGDNLTWRLVALGGVQLELPKQHPEVILHEQASPWRELRIPVALADGAAIAAAWREEPTPRPLTHQVWLQMLDHHGVRIEAARIISRRGSVFYAEMDTMGPRGRQVVPCRPSDALALVLRVRPPVPVLVAEWVFEPPPAP